MASVPSVRTRTSKQGQLGVPGEPLQARGTSAEPAPGHAPIAFRACFCFPSPQTKAAGVFGATAVFYCMETQKSPEHIFREKGRKGMFSFLTQEEDLLQLPICLPCWAELAGKSPKGTTPGEDQVDELMGRLSWDVGTMPASPTRRCTRAHGQWRQGGVCWIKGGGAARTGGHRGPQCHQKV